MSTSAHGFGDPCLPTWAKAAPSGARWIHEIKHDGYRLMIRRTAEGVRIKTRRGYDWTDRFPLIVEAAARLGATSFVLDGEGVILRQDGVADFDRLHTRRHDGEVQLLGFDLLELEGDDLRQEPLERRKIPSRQAAAPLAGQNPDRRAHRGSRRFGHDLASRSKLTPKQAKYGRKLVIKYQRQLDPELVATVKGK